MPTVRRFRMPTKLVVPALDRVMRSGATSGVTHAQVKQIVDSKIANQAELKRYVVLATTLTTSSAGAISPITQGIAQGDTLSTRDGNQIVVKHLVVRRRLVALAASFVAQRMIVFWDSMAQGAVPAVTDVLNSANLVDGFNPTTMQQRRFHVLADTYLASVANGANAVATQRIPVKLNHRVTFDAATNVASANGRGAMFCLFIGDVNTGTYDFSFEVEFTDS